MHNAKMLAYVMIISKNVLDSVRRYLDQRWTYWKKKKGGGDKRLPKKRQKRGKSILRDLFKKYHKVFTVGIGKKVRFELNF